MKTEKERDQENRRRAKRRAEAAAEKAAMLTDRKCLGCGKMFPSTGPGNRKCPPCLNGKPPHGVKVINTGYRALSPGSRLTS